MQTTAVTDGIRTPKIEPVIEPVIEEIVEELPLVTGSGPVHLATPEAELKPHISAPSYLQSLAENDLPPFKKPPKETRPKLLAGPTQLLTEAEVVEMIAASDADPADGLKNYLGEFLVRAKVVQNYELTELEFLVRFLIETVDYSAQRDFSAFQLSILITIYMTTHQYFKWYYWSAPVAIWNYFKELMIRHTLEDSPDGQECFSPIECYDILTHFHTMYICNLPLIHILTFGAHRMNLNWPFKLVK